jgi:uncharacterized protein
MTHIPHPPWTLEHLRTRRDAILAVAAQNRAFNVRVVGSIAREEAHPGSDVDLLVSFHPGSSIFDQVGLSLDLQELLGCEVDLLTDHPDAEPVTAAARAHAIPL